MLSHDEATHFIENGLGITNFHCKLQNDPLKTVNDVIFEFHKSVPFQNLAVLFKEAGTMHIPDLNQVKEDVLNLRGGLCYTNNVFMKYLLDAAGLKTFHVAGICNPKHPNNHVATVICDLLTQGQRHLVDVGCGYPTYQAIELTEDTGIFRSAYLTYCFKKDSPDKFVRYHSKEPDVLPSQKCYDVCMTPRDLPYFQEAMLEVYKDRFPKKLRVIRFYDDKIVAFREDGKSVIKQTFEGPTVNKLELRSCKDIVHHISDVLPCYSKAEIDLAVTNWQSNLQE